jgi:cell wall-associated NlpC family hydrolase
MTTQGKPGDFFLVAISGRVGLLIKVLQWLNGDGWTGFQHAGILLDDGTVLEAEPGGARIAPVSEYDGSDITYSSWDLTDAQRASVVAVARTQVGVPYSALDYLVLALHRFHIQAPGLRARIATSKRAICSQLCDQIYHAAGLNMFTDGRYPGYVTPGDLVQALAGPVAGKDRR